jgi:hypothetical protein
VKPLRSIQPLVIFESWPHGRDGLFTMFDNLGYRIAPLLLRPHSPPRQLESCSFFDHPGRNFIAFGAEQVGGEAASFSGILKRQTGKT